jgi:hypothetical protein
MELQFTTSQVETLVPGANQYFREKVIPVAGLRGKARRYSTADVIMIVLAARLTDAGLPVAVAADVARACGGEFSALLLDDDAERWILAFPEKKKWTPFVYHSAADALSALENAPDAYVVNVRRTIHDTMGRIIEAMKGGQR